MAGRAAHGRGTITRTEPLAEPITHLDLKHVHRFKDRHGKLRHYLRVPGQAAIALPGEVGSREFMAAYQRGLRGVPQAGAEKALRGAPGTLDAVVASYYQSEAWVALRATTQTHYRLAIEQFRATHGDCAVRLLNEEAVEHLLSSKAGRPAARNRRLRLLRTLMGHARKVMKLIRTDPTAGIDRIRERNRGFRSWEAEHLAAYRARHHTGTVARLALELLLNVGQRRGDTAKMGRQHMSGGCIRLKQSKTGQAVDVPILPELAAELAHVPAGQMTFLLAASGKPHTSNGFYQWFKDRCGEVPGLPADLAPHGLRKACGNRLADAGCSATDIMAVLGHRTLSEAQKYVAEADRRRGAERAMARVVSLTLSQTGK